MRIVISWLDILRKVGQKTGPYLMLEILMPGGTLLALLLFLYRRRKPDTGRDAQRAIQGVLRALAGAFEQSLLMRAPIKVPARVSKSGYPQRSMSRSDR
jgi:hypothetical protein